MPTRHHSVNAHNSRSKAGLSSHQASPTILVDASNVAFTNHNEPGAQASLDNIVRMRQHLKALGYRPVFIADAQLRHEIDQPEQLNALEQSGDILQSPMGTQADYFLLALAHREHLPIVSNDSFRDRRREFPDAVRCRVPYMIVDQNVILDKERLPGRPKYAA